MPDKLWTKNFIFITITNFFLGLVLFSLVVVMTNYSLSVYDVSTGGAALTASIYLLGSLFGRLYTAKASQKYNAKKLLVIMILISFLLTFVYIIYIPVGWMIALRLVHGFFMSVAMTMLGTLVVQIIPKNRRGEGIGYYGISLVVASAIGPFLGVMLISEFGFKSIFIMTIFLSLALLFFAYLLKISSQKPVYSKENLQIKQFIEPSTLPIAILFTLVCIAYSSLIAFISNYSVSLNLVNLGNFFF